MGTYCMTCKNKECINYNRSIYFDWICEKYFNNGYTNADHIRQLDDKSLAEFISSNLSCDSSAIIFQWLQSQCLESNIKGEIR